MIKIMISYQKFFFRFHLNNLPASTVLMFSSLPMTYYKNSVMVEICWYYFSETHHEASQTQWRPVQRSGQTCATVCWFRGSWLLWLGSGRSVLQTAQTQGIYKSLWGDHCIGSSFQFQPHIYKSCIKREQRGRLGTFQPAHNTHY